MEHGRETPSTFYSARQDLGPNAHSWDWDILDSAYEGLNQIKRLEELTQYFIPPLM